jgi:Rrf2 family iron-sulfur cluster assembly transcriptional regulator
MAHDLWEELGNQIYLFLSSVTVADVVSRRVLGASGVISAPPSEKLNAAAG